MDVFWGQLQILKQALAEGRMTYTDTATLGLILVSIWFSVTQHPDLTNFHALLSQIAMITLPNPSIKRRITQGEEE